MENFFDSLTKDRDQFPIQDVIEETKLIIGKLVYTVYLYKDLDLERKLFQKTTNLVGHEVGTKENILALSDEKQKVRIAKWENLFFCHD